MSNMVTSNGQAQDKDTQRVTFSEQKTCYDSIPQPPDDDPALSRKRSGSQLWSITRKRLDSIVLHGNPLREKVIEHSLSPLHFTVKNCLAVFVIFLLIGTVVFSFLVECWSIIDSLYFTVVTLTTVGYGDLTPSTPLAKLFTCIFTLTGVTFIGVALGVLAAYVLDVEENAFLENRKDSKKRFINHLNVESHDDISSFFREVSTRSEESDTEEKRHNFWPKFFNLVLHRFLPTQAALYIVVYIMYGREEWGWLSVLYYLVISSTTVGYGDFTPISQGERAFGIIFVLVSVGTMGDMFVRVADLVLEERRLNYLHFLKCRELKLFHIKEISGGDDKVSMLEYVEFILKKLELVDEKMLEDLHDQFKALDVNDSGFISKEDLKEQMKRSILKARKKLALSAYKKDLLEMYGELSGELPRELSGELRRELSGELPRELSGELPRELPRELPGELSGELSGESFGRF